jgi:hypothetical protein
MPTCWHEPSVALLVAKSGVHARVAPHKKRFAAEALQVVLALHVAKVVLFGGQLEHRRGELRGTHLQKDNDQAKAGAKNYASSTRICLVFI